METTLPFNDTDIQTMVVQAVEKFFSTMLAEDVTTVETLVCGDPSTDPNQPAALDTDEPVIASAVGYIGDVNGVVYLYLEETLAKRVTAQFLGMEISEVEADGIETVNDALGEVSNMIVGTFKNSMCDRGHNCRLTIPSILRGKHFAIQTTSSVHRKIFRFQAFGTIFAADLLMKAGE